MPFSSNLAIQMEPLLFRLFRKKNIYSSNSIGARWCGSGICEGYLPLQGCSTWPWGRTRTHWGDLYLSVGLGIPWDPLEVLEEMVGEKEREVWAALLWLLPHDLDLINSGWIMDGRYNIPLTLWWTVIFLSHAQCSCDELLSFFHCWYNTNVAHKKWDNNTWKLFLSISMEGVSNNSQYVFHLGRLFNRLYAFLVGWQAVFVLKRMREKRQVREQLFVIS